MLFFFSKLFYIELTLFKEKALIFFGNQGIELSLHYILLISYI